MANLIETNLWQEDLYRIETTDPVVGGEEGIANKQAKILGSRTRYLKAEMEKRATLASPTFTGSPKATTPAPNSNDERLATTAFVKAAIAALVGSAPAALDTLAELATALGNDSNLKQVLLAEIGNKASKSEFTSFLDLFIGAPIAIPTTTLPVINIPGYTVMTLDGGRFSTSMYPKLAKVYPTGVKPDLRGEFIRGWSNGRGVDSGRGILTEQGDAKKQSYVEFQYLDIAQSSLLNLSGDVTGETWQWSSVSQHWEQITNSQFNSYVLTPSSATYANQSSQGIQLNDTLQKLWIGTGNETRPRNVAFQYICLAA